MNAVSNDKEEKLVADHCRKAWDETFADYQAMREAFEAMPYGPTSRVDRMCNLTYDVQDRLIEALRAPDVDAFAAKIEFIRGRDLGGLPDEWLDALLADVRHLVGGQPDLEASIAAYLAVRQEEAAYPRGMSNAVAEDFGSRRSSTFRAVVQAPVRSIADVIRKLEIYDAEYRDDDTIPHGDVMAILGDLRRLPVCENGQVDPHMGWLAERDRLLNRYNGGEGPDDNNLLGEGAQELEQRILTTAAKACDGILAKALLIVGETALIKDSKAEKVSTEAKAMGLIEWVA